MKSWRWCGVLVWVALMWLVILPQPVAAADVTVPANLPEGFDMPTISASGSQFRTQPNWYTHGYIVSVANTGVHALVPEDASLTLENEPAIDAYGAPVGDQYYYAIVHNGGTVPMKASFHKGLDYFGEGAEIHTKMQVGDGPVKVTGGKLGDNPSIGITGNFGAVWIGEEYDYIDYLLTFQTVTMPTWFRYQIDIITNETHATFHSQLFPVLVIPDDWAPPLSTPRRVLFGGQSTTLDIAGLDQTLQPEYVWQASPPSAVLSGNSLTITNEPAVVGAVQVYATFTVPAHPMWGTSMTYIGPPLELYLARLKNLAVNFRRDAHFSVALSAGLMVQRFAWRFNGADQTGDAQALRLSEVTEGGTVHWQASLRNLSGEVIEAAADATLQVLYPDALMLLKVPDLIFMHEVGGAFQSPTVQELIAGQFAGRAALSQIPGEGSSWLTAAGGELVVADGRTNPDSPWQLRVMVGHFQSSKAPFTSQAEIRLLLTDDKEVVNVSAPIVAGQASFVTLASRPDGANREYVYDVQAVLALGAISNPLAGEYSATVNWELAAVPTPRV